MKSCGYCGRDNDDASGFCRDSGYTHIAIPWRDERDAANAVAHELTHDCLAHLQLPLWLNEGVTLRLQPAIAERWKASGWIAPAPSEENAG